MKVIRSLEEIREPFKNAVITIGNFDGVHLGHQSLFQQVVEKAEAIDGTAIAMTFEPHPLRVLTQNGHPPLITLIDQKIELIARTQLDALICVPFTREFAALTARQFVEDILLRQIGMRAIVVGKDYTFGRNREGNIHQLTNFAELFDFDIVLVDWIETPGGPYRRISSTNIRELIHEGRVDRVPSMLGRYYQIRGQVKTGRNRGGKLLGFPTANINLQDELCPKRGIYAVTVEHDGRQYQGVANIGYSPTFDDHVFTVEVYILDFDRSIYGDQIRVNFIQRIRDEIKFDSLSELSAQIQRDVTEARQILANVLG